MTTRLFTIPFPDEELILWQEPSPSTQGVRAPGTTALSQEGTGGWGDFYVSSDNGPLAAVFNEFMTGWKPIPQEFRHHGHERTRPIPYNPLTLVGLSGSGKSHLLQVAARLWSLHNRAPADVIVTTGDDLAREFANAVQLDELHTFRRRMRHCRLLAIDRLEGLTDRLALQEELARILDYAVQRSTQVILTASQFPQQLHLTPFLHSRISAGLVLRIAPPHAEARQAILRQLLSDAGVTLPDEELLRISQLTTTVAQLKGTVSRLSAAIHTDRGDIGHILHSAAAGPGHDPAQWMSIVVQLVARRHRLSRRVVAGSSRRRAVSRARGLAMLLLRDLGGLSFKEIGRQFRGRDHTTVMHACQMARRRCESDLLARAEYDELTQQIQDLLHRATAAPGVLA